MDIDTDPPESQIGSSPPTDALEEPTLPTNAFLHPIHPIRAPLASIYAGGSPSSDPLSKRGDVFTPVARTNQRPQATAEPQSNKRARMDQNNLSSDFDFDFGPSTRPNLNKVQDLVYKARDLLVEAYTASANRTEQTNLLDLIQVFREYTESGIIRKTTSILASQVANLERATRKVEILAKPKPSQSPKPSQRSENRISENPPPSQNNGTNQPKASYAQVANTSPTNNWTTINTKELAKAKLAKAQKEKEKAKLKEKDRRLVLLSSTTATTQFSSLRLRNLINDAFKKAGQSELVIRSISKTMAENIVLITTDGFSSQFLLDHKSIWEGIIPHKEAKRDQNYYKVAIHGVPISDFNSSDGLALIKSEIVTFNKGLNPIGVNWLTKLSVRQEQRTRFGSIVVAFSTIEEATRAQKQRLYIAGVSVKVVKFHTIPLSAQCSNCQGFGHLETKCRNSLACGLCASNSHPTRQHKCSECLARATSCKHLVPKCTNCKGPHIASSLNCEVRQALFKPSL